MEPVNWDDLDTRNQIILKNLHNFQLDLEDLNKEVEDLDKSEKTYKQSLKLLMLRQYELHYKFIDIESIIRE